MAKRKRARKGKGRHVLTTEERKRGVLKSLASKKTPPKLKAGLRKWAKKKGWVD